MKTELNNIGTWGRLHYDFLYRNQRSVINAMRLKGTLHDYFMGIDKDAEGKGHSSLAFILAFVLFLFCFSLTFKAERRERIRMRAAPKLLTSSIFKQV